MQLQRRKALATSDLVYGLMQCLFQTSDILRRPGGVWGGLEVGVSCLCNLFAVSIWSPLAYLLVPGAL